MGSRENEKFRKTQRRLAAVAFLTNISLSGSYKDATWCLEHARDVAQAGAAHCSTDTNKDGSRIRGRSEPQGEMQEHDTLGPEVGCRVDSHDFRHSDLENHVPESLSASRIRANTGSSVTSLKTRYQRFMHEPEGMYPAISHRHAHLSSAESVEHGGRIRQISTSNISDISSAHAKELKILNLREIPMPKIRDERLVIMLARRTPLLIFSALPYARHPRHTRSIERSEGSRRTRNLSGNRPLSALSDPDPLELLVHTGEEEVSYGYLLQPTQKSNRPENAASTSALNLPANLRHKMGGEPVHGESVDLHTVKHPYLSRCISNDGVKLHGSRPDLPPTVHEAETQDNPDGSMTGSASMPYTGYSPHLLDDPEFRAGKHRTLLTFPSYITSVMDYCKASDLKKELNDKFKDRFPHVQLTLSKLRSLKREMRRVAKSECNVDVLTVAQAYVYFEKLILASFVTKYNRKLCSGACLLLSAKLNDVKGENLHSLIEKIENTFRVSRKDLMSFEFAVLVALEFALHVPTWEVFPHYQRLLYES